VQQLRHHFWRVLQVPVHDHHPSRISGLDPGEDSSAKATCALLALAV
jgi:hypothetical protein